MGGVAYRSRWPDVCVFVPVCVPCGEWFSPFTPVHFKTPCAACAGVGCERCAETGLHPAAGRSRWAGYTLPALQALDVDGVNRLLAELQLPASAARVVAEISTRLAALLQSMGVI